MSVKEQVSLPTQRICSRCKFVSSQEVCKACVLLEGLNKGLPKLGIGKSSKAKRMLEEYHSKQEQNGTDILANVVNELNDTNNVAVDKSKSKSRSKRKECNSNHDVICNNSKNNCCGGSSNCRSKEMSNIDEQRSNKKLDMLLEQYGLDESPNGDKNNVDKKEANDTHVSDDSDSEQALYKEEEEDTCAGSCSKMGSLQIGF